MPSVGPRTRWLTCSQSGCVTAESSASRRHLRETLSQSRLQGRYNPTGSLPTPTSLATLLHSPAQVKIRRTMQYRREATALHVCRQVELEIPSVRCVVSLRSISQIHIVAVTQRLQIPYSWDHERQEGRTPSARTADHRSPSTACSTAVVSCVRHKKRSDEIAPLHCYASHMSQASDARDALTPDGRPRPGRSVALSLSLSLKCHLKAP